MPPREMHGCPSLSKNYSLPLQFVNIRTGICHIHTFFFGKKSVRIRKSRQSLSFAFYDGIRHMQSLWIILRRYVLRDFCFPRFTSSNSIFCELRRKGREEHKANQSKNNNTRGENHQSQVLYRCTICVIAFHLVSFSFTRTATDSAFDFP